MEEKGGEESVGNVDHGVIIGAPGGVICQGCGHIASGAINGVER